MKKRSNEGLHVGTNQLLKMHFLNVAVEMHSNGDGKMKPVKLAPRLHKEFGQQGQRPLPTAQISFFRDNIYRYYGISEKILTSPYTEQEWNSFYEAALKPIAIQLSLSSHSKGKADPRTVHLAVYSSSRRVRKKNIRRIIRGK